MLLPEIGLKAEYADSTLLHLAAPNSRTNMHRAPFLGLFPTGTTDAACEVRRAPRYSDLHFTRRMLFEGDGLQRRFIVGRVPFQSAFQAYFAGPLHEFPSMPFAK